MPPDRKRISTTSPYERDSLMLCMTRSRIAAIGVAALLSTSTIATVAAEDEYRGMSATWDGQTTFKDLSPDVQIKIRGKVQGVAHSYSLDKDYIKDAAKVTRAGAGYKDGIGLEDAEIQFEGTAYKHVTFRMRYDVENTSKIGASTTKPSPSVPGVPDHVHPATTTSDKNYIKLDKWWVGLTAVPYIGEITMREVDEHMGFIESESWIEETVVHNAFNYPTMVGFMWKKQVDNTGIEMLDKRLDLWAATGMANNEIGATDKDWNINASVCWQPVKMDGNLNAYIKFDYALINNNGGDYTAAAGMYASKVSGPTMATFKQKAEDVTVMTPAAALTFGQFAINAQYYMVDGTKREGHSGTLDKDFSLNGWTVAAGFALTGENEARNIGIKKPKKALKGDNILENFGALELVARISMLDMADSGFEATDVVNSAGVISAANLNTALGARGATVTEYQIGLNWYPTGNMLVGLMYSMDTFEGNYAGSKSYDASMLGLRTMVKF